MNPAAAASRFAGPVAGLAWAPVGGGFSGAAVWRGADPAGRPLVALKAWPPGVAADELRAVHARVARLAHLSFVPRIHATPDGDTVVAHAGRVWDASDWMPGEPERGVPSAARIGSAAAALAAVHAAWEPAAPRFAPCPAVARRLRVIDQWDAARPDRVPRPELGAVVSRAARELPPHLAAARKSLAAWANRAVPLRPCVGDVWPAHVLFSDTAVTGLIDFGAAKDDHVAADVARLFGGYGAVAAGVAAYRAAGGALPDELTEVLAESGIACAAAAWVLRVYAGEQVGGAAGRLAELLDLLG